MKVRDGGMTSMIGFPHMEAWGVIEAMEQAEKAGDIEALKWCARRLCWLYEEGEVYSGDMFCTAEHLFNSTWKAFLKNDPPPASIAAIIASAEEPEPVTAAAAEKALDTVKAFLEKTLAKKGLAAALTAVGILRSAIKDTGDGE